MNELMRHLIEELKRVWYIPAVICVGIVLMIVQTEPKEDVAVDSTVQVDQYIYQMESCVREMLKSIDGAGDCSVTITVSDHGRTEYVRENGEVLVVTDEQGNQSAVIANESVPAIAGVTISSSGSGSVSIRENIIKAVSTLLGIGTNKVCVVSNGG